MIVKESIPAYRQLAACLEADGVAIIPGVTNYSLVVNAASDRAIRRLYAIKNRSGDKPLAMLVPPHDAANHVVLSPRNRRGLLFMGDPIVLIAPSAPGLRISPLVNAGSSRTGIFWLNTRLHTLLYHFAGFPIAGTSLNRSGEAMVTRFADARTRFAERVDLVVDGGDCPLPGKAATVLDLSEEPPILLRPGFVTESVIRAAFPECGGCL
jgi:L-threonylcarbamoyladenylate synthase